MSTIATTIARPKTYSAEELQALHLAMNAKAKRKKMIQKTALVIMNLIVCLFMLFPLLYTISVAFMPSGELYTMAMNIVPKHPTLENFVEAFHKIPLVRFVLNSFLVAGSITLGQIVTCSLAAFAFSFLNFKGKNVLFMLVMATMMVPGEATIISNYLTVGSLGLLDTYIVLILPSLTSAMGIFLFRQFYMTFPISLYESAKLDGCGWLKRIVKLDLPMILPQIKYILITKIGEAFAKFQKEVFNLFYQSGFQFCFQDRVFYAKKSKIITAFEHFIGKHRLCGWQCLLEIIIQNFILL